MPIDGRPSVQLLVNPERVKQDVSSYLLGDLARGKSLEPIAWRDVAAKAYAPRLAKSAHELAERVHQSFGGGPTAEAAVRTLAARLEGDGPVTVALKLEPNLAKVGSAEQREIAQQIVGNAIGVLVGAVLVQRGGTWRSELGRNHQIELGDDLHEPFLVAKNAIDRPSDLLGWIEKGATKASDAQQD